MRITLNLSSAEDYKIFLAVKALPYYSFEGRTAVFPDEYAGRIGRKPEKLDRPRQHESPQWMFDYQKDITGLAIQKKKYAVFADCGLGKTPIFLEFARHARQQVAPRRVLIVSPLMVIPQTIAESIRWYGSDLQRPICLTQVHAKHLQAWLDSTGDQIGITNYEALSPNLKPGKLAVLILDESSMLKSHYGKWGQKCLELGKGLEWKLCCTGTPAPNDRIEYANHAVFLDAFPTVNSFLAKFFVNRGQTNERWALKPHALEPFYRALSHWSIFLTNPATYGWKDNTEQLPPMHVHVEQVDLTVQQRNAVMDQTSALFPAHVGGITSRSRLGQIAKGTSKGKSCDTLKPMYIRRLVDSWIANESTIIWCLYNNEQETIERVFPEAVSLKGTTPTDVRLRAIEDFKAGRCKVLVSKPKILGFGLNLQIATRQVFSGLQDSYEQFYQAVKRSNRYGATRPLHVHIPATEIEMPMIRTVLEKAKRVQQDTEEQERIYLNAIR